MSKNTYSIDEKIKLGVFRLYYIFDVLAIIVILPLLLLVSLGQ